MNYGLMFDLRYGFLSSCPSNLGTGLVVSVGIKLPRLSGRPDMLRDICDEYGLESHPAKYDSGVSDGTPVLIITTRRVLPLYLQPIPTLPLSLCTNSRTFPILTHDAQP